MDVVSIGAFPADEVPFFARLPRERREALEQHIGIRSFAAGERVLEEGAANPGRLYVVLEGEAALCNRGKTFSTHTMADYETGSRGKDEVIGAISFLDGEPFSSSVLAKTPLTLAVLDFSAAALPRVAQAQGGDCRGAEARPHEPAAAFDRAPPGQPAKRGGIRALQERGRQHRRNHAVAAVGLHAAPKRPAAIHGGADRELRDQPIHHRDVRRRNGACDRL